MRTALRWLVAATWRRVTLGCLVVLLSGYLGCVNHLGATEQGLAWNRFTGALQMQPGGFHVTWPWVSVSTIDTRPMRVCISSAGKSFSCKLVRFVPEAYREFVATEGHYYYWWANRISFNGSYPDEYRGMRDILRGYAYGSVKYPFVEVLSDQSQ